MVRALDSEAIRTRGARLHRRVRRPRKALRSTGGQDGRHPLNLPCPPRQELIARRAGCGCTGFSELHAPSSAREAGAAAAARGGGGRGAPGCGCCSGNGGKGDDSGRAIARPQRSQKARNRSRRKKKRRRKKGVYVDVHHARRQRRRVYGNAATHAGRHAMRIQWLQSQRRKADDGRLAQPIK